MANTDFGILLKTLLDKSGINSELEQVQKIVNKYTIDIMPELKTASLKNQMKAVSQEIANDFNKAFGTNLTGNDVFKAFENQAKQAEKAVKEEAKAIETARKEQESLTNAMAKGREQAELSRQAEQKRQQMAQNNAINKGLEQEYQERQKNIEAAKKQAELDKQNALAFTKSASERLSSAISKYSYGDTSDANAMMKQMNRGLSNFGDLSNVQGNITQLSSTVDKIIADLKLSHEQSLQALNEEIEAEQTLQSQKDAFNKKNINAIDYEIQKREEEAKTFSSMLQAQMQEQQEMQSEVNKIQLSMSTGGYESKVDSLIGKTQQWVDANGNARISTDALQTAMNNLNTAYANITATGGNTVANQQALIEAERALDTEVKKVQSSVTSMNATMAKSTAVDSLRQKVQMFYDTNTKSHRTYGAQLRAIVSELATGAEVPITRLRQIQQEFIGIQNSARQAGKLGLSFFDTLKRGMQKFSYWTSSTFLVMKTIQSIKSAVSTVKELDSALVDLKKTTTMTAKELEDFYYASNETAKKMGVTTQSIIEQASAWSRLGYSSQEAAIKMAEYSSMFATISPGMDLDSATDGLVSVMKAFKIGADDVDDVVDGIMSKINIIGNTQALNNSDIVDFLTRSSSAMAEANNSLEETIALGTAATEITRDAASVGNMLKTVSMRIKLSPPIW